VTGPGQGDLSPHMVTSPDLAGGTFPREFHLRWREPAPSPAVEHAPVRHPGACRGDARPRRAGRHLHPLARLPDTAWHHQPGRRTARRRGRRQRLRPARLRGPMPAPAAPRIITTSWSSRWTPGWAWQPERGDRIWTPASAVTYWAEANWSPPTTRLSGSMPAPASPIRPAGARSQSRSDADHRVQSTRPVAGTRVTAGYLKSVFGCLPCSFTDLLSCVVDA
jgi:hypothetical protein